MLPVAKFEIDRSDRGLATSTGTATTFTQGPSRSAMLKTLQNARAKDFAFKQLAIQGEEKDVPADQVMGGPWPVMLGRARPRPFSTCSRTSISTRNSRRNARATSKNKHGIVVDVESAGAPRAATRRNSACRR